MRRLLHYMSAYKKESILGPLFKMLEASFELFVPLVVADMVDVGIRRGDASYILKMGGLLVLLALIGAVAVFGIYGPGYDAQQFIYFQF